MLNKFLFSSALTLTLLTAAPLSWAQDCDVNYEMVTTLFHPDPGSYAVWDSVYGEGKSLENFSSITRPVDTEQGAVLAGEKRDNEKAFPVMTLVQMDHRGRPLWEKFYTIPGLSKVIKILPLQQGYIVLANTARPDKKASLWLGFFDTLGALKSQKEIVDKESDLMAMDMISELEDKGWVIVATKTQKTGYGKNLALNKDASLYQTDTTGNVIRERTYEAGGDNEIMGISKTTFSDERSGYIATGYMKNSSGKKMGWVLRLEKDGALAWQQEYGRGLNAQVVYSTGYRQKYILAFGDVRPADAGTIGTWLMLLDSADGNVLWQRYYNGETGAHDYLARGLYVNKDSLITLMMQAEVPEEIQKAQNASKDKKNKDVAGKESDKEKLDSNMVGDIDIPDRTNYAHLLTLSPRGVTMAGDSYFQGQGVSVSQVIEGPRGERMIAGSTLSPPSQIKEMKDFPPEQTEDAFAMYGPVQEAPSPKADLPQGELSDKTKSGLALLNKKLKEQTSPEGKESTQEQNGPNLDNVQKNNDSKSESNAPILSHNGWVVIGEAPDVYEDPCKIPTVDIPEN